MMSETTSPPARKSVSLPAELWGHVDAYRFGNRITTESEAIRRLIELGLEAAKVQSAGQAERYP